MHGHPFWHGKRIIASVFNAVLLLVADQGLKDLLLVLVSVRAKTAFIRYQACNGLSMFPCKESVIKNELIQCRAWIFEIKLDHFDLIGKQIDWNLDALRNRNEFVFIFILVKDVVGGHWLDDFPQVCVLVQLLDGQAASLQVQKLCNVKHSLIFFPVEALEKITVMRLAQQRHSERFIDHVFHRLKAPFELRCTLDQGV